MAIRHYFVVAAERPYNPIVGERITYRVELDTALGSALRSKESTPAIVEELTIQVTYVEPSWGPYTSRVEGFTRNPRTMHASRVIGHHKTNDCEGEQRIGLLQVSEDD